MKKYRLLYKGKDGEYKPVEATFNSVEEAQEEVLCRIDHGSDISIFDYKVEEVEESITDSVKSYEEACEVLGIDKFDRIGEHTISLFNDIRVLNGKVDHIIALLKLETITAALNEGWEPDWKDRKQQKWYIGYSYECGKLYIDYHLIYLETSLSLYFKSEELARYAAKQFAEFYKQLLIEKV